MIAELAATHRSNNTFQIHCCLGKFVSYYLIETKVYYFHVKFTTEVHSVNFARAPG